VSAGAPRSMAEHDLVWYAAYGSNLLSERFGYYITGGSMPGRSVVHAGTRDPTPPLASRTWRVDHQLAFGGRSARWEDAGVAYLDPEPGSGSAVVRLWQVTLQQFEDIAAQENRLVPGELTVDVDEVIQAGSVNLDAGGYSRVLNCGSLDGCVVLSFTAAENREPVSPGAAYLNVVGRGLVECGMSVSEASGYLAAAAGVSLAWSVEQIEAELC